MNNPFFVYLSIWNLSSTEERFSGAIRYFQVGDHWLAEDETEAGFPRYYVTNKTFRRVTEKKWNPGYAVENLKNMVKY